MGKACDTLGCSTWIFLSHLGAQAYYRASDGVNWAVLGLGIGNAWLCNALEVRPTEGKSQKSTLGISEKRNSNKNCTCKGPGCRQGLRVQGQQ